MSTHNYNSAPSQARWESQNYEGDEWGSDEDSNQSPQRPSSQQQQYPSPSYMTKPRDQPVPSPRPYFPTPAHNNNFANNNYGPPRPATSQRPESPVRLAHPAQFHSPPQHNFRPPPRGRSPPKQPYHFAGPGPGASGRSSPSGFQPGPRIGSPSSRQHHPIQEHNAFNQTPIGPPHPRSTPSPERYRGSPSPTRSRRSPSPLASPSTPSQAPPPMSPRDNASSPNRTRISTPVRQDVPSAAAAEPQAPSTPVAAPDEGGAALSPSQDANETPNRSKSVSLAVNNWAERKRALKAQLERERIEREREELEEQSKSPDTQDLPPSKIRPDPGVTHAEPQTYPDPQTDSAPQLRRINTIRETEEEEAPPATPPKPEPQPSEPPVSEHPQSPPLPSHRSPSRSRSPQAPEPPAKDDTPVTRRPESPSSAAESAEQPRSRSQSPVKSRGGSPLRQIPDVRSGPSAQEKNLPWIPAFKTIDPRFSLAFLDQGQQTDDDQDTSTRPETTDTEPSHPDFTGLENQSQEGQPEPSKDEQQPRDADHTQPSIPGEYPASQHGTPMTENTDTFAERDAEESDKISERVERMLSPDLPVSNRSSGHTEIDTQNPAFVETYKRTHGRMPSDDIADDIMRTLSASNQEKEQPSVPDDQNLSKQLEELGGALAKDDTDTESSEDGEYSEDGSKRSHGRSVATRSEDYPDPVDSFASDHKYGRSLESRRSKEDDHSRSSGAVDHDNNSVSDGADVSSQIESLPLADRSMSQQSDVTGPPQSHMPLPQFKPHPPLRRLRPLPEYLDFSKVYGLSSSQKRIFAYHDHLERMRNHSSGIEVWIYDLAKQRGALSEDGHVDMAKLRSTQELPPPGDKSQLPQGSRLDMRILSGSRLGDKSKEKAKGLYNSIKRGLKSNSQESSAYDRSQLNNLATSDKDRKRSSSGLFGKLKFEELGKSMHQLHVSNSKRTVSVNDNANTLKPPGSSPASAPGSRSVSEGLPVTRQISDSDTSTKQNITSRGSSPNARGYNITDPDMGLSKYLHQQQQHQQEHKQHQQRQSPPPKFQPASSPSPRAGSPLTQMMPPERPRLAYRAPSSGLSIPLSTATTSSSKPRSQASPKPYDPSSDEDLEGKIDRIIEVLPGMSRDNVFDVLIGANGDEMRAIGAAVLATR